MCVGGGHGKSPIQILRDKAAKQTTTVTGPDGKTRAVGNGSVVEGVQGNTAASGQLGDRVAGLPAEYASSNPFFSAANELLGTILRINTPQQKKVTDPNAVGAGRIGRSYGASDLRIGR